MGNTLKAIDQEAYGRTHYEYSSDNKEIEIYIGGWFLASVSIKDISKEVGDNLFLQTALAQVEKG